MTRLSLVFALLLVSCILRPVSSTPVAPLSRDDRNEIFETIWRSIDQRYYDPRFNGVDWNALHAQFKPQVDTVTSDRSFYNLMIRMVGALHNAQTGVLPPLTVRTLAQRETITTGITIDSIDGAIVVRAVRPLSSADKAGVSPGMRVVRFNSQTIEERIESVAARIVPSSSVRYDRARRYVAAMSVSPASTTALELERADSSRLDVTIKSEPELNTPSVESRLLPSGIAYIRFSAFAPSIEASVIHAVRTNVHARGMIIDLRDNPGGQLNTMRAIAGVFFDEQMAFTYYPQRQNDQTGPHRIIYVGSGGRALYRGPLAVLVNLLSASGSEVFAGGMQQTKRAMIVGDTTCGCAHGSDSTRLKDGGELGIAIMEWFDMNGRRYEGAGVVPDVWSRASTADLRNRRDVVLERAESVLRH
jgi:C-terminal peptidase prc